MSCFGCHLGFPIGIENINLEEDLPKLLIEYISIMNDFEQYFFKEVK
jgi:hypothetical protein